MDEIETRLRAVSDDSVKAYQKWQASKRDPEAREALQDAIHEMRRVSARLEIEIAVSERDEMASRPIPIPPHRATRKGPQAEDDGDNTGNFNDDGGNGNNGGSGQSRPGSAARHMRRRTGGGQGRQGNE